MDFGHDLVHSLQSLHRGLLGCNKDDKLGREGKVEAGLQAGRDIRRALATLLRSNAEHPEISGLQVGLDRSVAADNHIHLAPQQGHIQLIGVSQVDGIEIGVRRLLESQLPVIGGALAVTYCYGAGIGLSGIHQIVNGLIG